MEISTYLEGNNPFIKIAKKLLYNFFYVVRKLFRKKNKKGNFVIIALHFLGDTVFAIPAISKVLNSINREVILLIYAETAPIYKYAFGDNVKLVTLKRTDFWGERIAGKKARATLKSLNPEVILDLTGVSKSVSLMLATRASKVVGLSREIFGGFYDCSYPIRSTPHLMDIYLDAIQCITKVEDREKLKSFPLKRNNSGKIVIHLFAGWKSKEWGIQNYFQLAGQLNINYNVLIVYPPGSLTSEQLLVISGKNIKVKETVEIGELINELKDADLFIGNDTGAAYISSFIGIPTFIIFGPTNPVFHIPYGSHHRHIIKKLPCSPEPDKKICYTDGGRDGRCLSYECMNQLTVNEVLMDVLKFADDLKIKKRSANKSIII